MERTAPVDPEPLTLIAPSKVTRTEREQERQQNRQKVGVNPCRYCLFSWSLRV